MKFTIVIPFRHAGKLVLRNRSVMSLSLWACMTFAAQAAQDSWRFDFGYGRSAGDHHLVAADTMYTNESGFGLEPGSVVRAEIHNGFAGRSGFLTGERPFFFSVAVPEGDYRVIVKLGDSQGASETTVKAEITPTYA